MKTSTERLLIAGILVSGLVAFWAHSASASPSAPDGDVPASFYPLLTPLERQFVWSESNSNTGPAMVSRASVYQSTVLADGSVLSAPALAALAAEAAAKMVHQ